MLLLLICVFYTFTSSVYSQLANSNMRLLANKNDHFTSTLYSAVWGYTAENGREYAILGCPNGTAFYDITDTTNIVEVDFLPGLTSSWREMKTFGKNAYIVSEASGSGLQVVNLKYLPDSVSLLNTYTFPGYTRTHTISQSGPYLYMSGGDYGIGGIFILDLTQNTVNPTKRGEWELAYIHDCRVVNDTIWGAGINDGNIYVINAVNKNSLVTINSWLNLPDPGPHNTALSSDRRFLFVTDEINGPSARLLKIWNVSNIMNPLQVATWQPTSITTSIVHNIETYGNYAVVAHYTAGVRVLNITNPAAPSEIAWYDTYPSNNGNTYNGCWGVYMFPSGKIVASDRQTGLYVLRSNAVLVGNQHNNQNTPKQFALKQNYPNPFNPVTKIEYSLPKNVYATIKVYDILGKEIATLVDKFERAGNHWVTYDAANLPSGVYFYTLKAGDYTETKRMTLVK
jgi:choice-of-anchor B domain-containing protein